MNFEMYFAMNFAMSFVIRGVPSECELQGLRCGKVYGAVGNRDSGRAVAQLHTDWAVGGIFQLSETLLPAF